MTITPGVYIITNVQQGNPVFLENPDDEVPLRGHYKPEDACERWHWRVIDLKNGAYSIQNVEYKRYAHCGSRPGLKAHVLGGSGEQEWDIQAIGCEGEYTITATDTRNVWMLPDTEERTPVELFNIHTDRRCWWTFTNLEPGAPVEEDLADGAYLFALKPLPILPFSPLSLDFVIIQQMPEDSITNASRIVGGVCDRLMSSRRVRRDALCVNIIEVTSVGSDIFFERSCDFVTSERLLNLGGPPLRWEECDGVSSIPRMAIRGLRANSTKIAILNFDVTLFQQSELAFEWKYSDTDALTTFYAGGRATINLIDDLAKHDISLVLTLIQPTWGDTFSDSLFFKELEELSSESQLFEKKSEFSDYLIAYNETVALPRLAGDRKLRDTIHSNLPRIIEVLKDNNDDTRSAAVSALSQLAEHADLHDVIFQTVHKITEMLKGNSGEAEAAASTLVELAERAELHDQIFYSVHKTIETLKGSGSGENLFNNVDVGEAGGSFSDGPGRTSLAWAAESGYEAIVRLLLMHSSVFVDAKDENGWTPLSLAAANGHDGVVRLLLAQEGVDADSKDTIARTPLYNAARDGHYAVVQLLLAQGGVDVNSKRTGGMTPLYAAAHNGHNAIVQLLLAQEGVEVDSKGTDSATPLYVAAQNGHDAVIQLLLAQEDVNVNFPQSDGATPLYVAAHRGHDAAVRLLLAQVGVDVNSEGMGGTTPLYAAAYNGHEAVVRLLLEQEGIDINSKYTTGPTPLYAAAYNGHYAVVRLLIALENVDVNPKDTNGATPLYAAAYNGHDAVVQLLLAQEGVDVNAMSNDGQTPLMRAEEGNHESVVRLLREKIEKMGDTTNGETAEDFQRA